jgi:hypothetical protein
MSAIYRIFPVLWEGPGCIGTQTVYGIDRPPAPGTFKTACSSRTREDPASSWDSPTFWRLLPAPDSVSGCCSPSGASSVTWPTLMTWISWIQTIGYSISPNTDMSRLKPYSDIYIVGP